MPALTTIEEKPAPSGLKKIKNVFDIHDDKKELATRKENIDARILKELRNFINLI